MTRATVCPPAPAHVCASRLVEPLARTCMLTRVCARDSQATPRPSAPPPPPSSPPPSPPSPFPARRSSPRHRRAPIWGAWRRLVHANDAPGSGPRQRVCPHAGCSFVRGCGVVLMGEGRAGQKRICTLWDTSACLLMLLRSPIGPRVHETAKIGVACSCGIIPCGKSCCIPLRGPKRTLFCLNLTQVREYDYPKLCPHHRPADLQGLCELR